MSIKRLYLMGTMKRRVNPTTLKGFQQPSKRSKPFKGWFPPPFVMLTQEASLLPTPSALLLAMLSFSRLILKLKNILIYLHHQIDTQNQR